MMAWTTSGERKASERVMRIERSLQRWRDGNLLGAGNLTGEEFL